MTEHTEHTEHESIEDLRQVALVVTLERAGRRDRPRYELAAWLPVDPADYAQAVRGEQVKLNALLRRATETLAEDLVERRPEVDGAPIALEVTREPDATGSWWGAARVAGGLLGGGSWSLTPLLWMDPEDPEDTAAGWHLAEGLEQ